MLVGCPLEYPWTAFNLSQWVHVCDYSVEHLVLLPQQYKATLKIKMSSFISNCSSYYNSCIVFLIFFVCLCKDFRQTKNMTDSENSFKSENGTTLEKEVQSESYFNSQIIVNRRPMNQASVLQTFVKLFYDYLSLHFVKCKWYGKRKN